MKLPKLIYPIIFWFLPLVSSAQNFQLHYDLRHTLDPEIQEKNFPMISFEYFKEFDSLGSFLFKGQTFLNGENNNLGETFIKVSQSLKFWKPQWYLSLNYSGGVGTTPTNFGYYINNAYAVGINHPFGWKGAFFSANVQYRYTAFKAPSHDLQVIFYLWKGMFDYKLVMAGSLVGWTENRNQGTEYTSALTGKKIAFFGDPQLWLKIKGCFSVGTRINLYYNIFGDKNDLKVYPTIGTQIKF
ncbi:DUF5020 family protein [Algoriphagus sp. AGSA1]|uniref:DUF5020 family protein n=1 Tax=Algoriphagus sp. AGSA1 TaxID=2907213 RepID=UPI001F35BAC0|nr:DUF5020 family protein [Algoriphagus sp. AGSA1]MCE7055186.1 DUF5020 family protein [Algoriphagus sp. AGSA1]